MRILLLSLLSWSAFAEDVESPEFLLDDLGVRIDLPDDWTMTLWADWEFKAERSDQSVKIWAWGSPGQVIPSQDDLGVWAGVCEAKATELGGQQAETTSKLIVEAGGRTTARTSVAFDFQGKVKGVLECATFAVEGQVFHMAALAAEKRKKLCAAALDDLLEGLEVNKPPVSYAGPQKVSASGIEVTLPSGWHAPHPKEMPAVSMAAHGLGLKDIEACWSAVKPAANGEHDIMIGCQGGLLLGVVDEYSFAGIEADEVRPVFFGSVAVDPALPVELSDRTGFAYEIASTDGLRVGAVPYDQGIARYWAVGGSTRGTALTEALTAAMKGSTFSGPHPVGPMDQVSHYLTYRPTSPLVLGPAGLFLALLGGLGFLLGRGGGHKYEDLD